MNEPRVQIEDDGVRVTMVHAGGQRQHFWLGLTQATVLARRLDRAVDEILASEFLGPGLPEHIADGAWPEGLSL